MDVHVKMVLYTSLPECREITESGNDDGKKLKEYSRNRAIDFQTRTSFWNPKHCVLLRKQTFKIVMKLVLGSRL